MNLEHIVIDEDGFGHCNQCIFLKIKSVWTYKDPKFDELARGAKITTNNNGGNGDDGELLWYPSKYPHLLYQVKRLAFIFWMFLKLCFLFVCFCSWIVFLLGSILFSTNDIVALIFGC